jgi:hypothetical protein
MNGWTCSIVCKITRSEPEWKEGRGVGDVKGERVCGCLRVEWLVGWWVGWLVIIVVNAQ